jgi:glycosyltransferase involved in cell wall biosynthesis
MTKLSVLLIVKNEERQIANCLKTVAFADEIIVILDKCTDNSENIVKQYTKNIFKGGWEIEGKRRNFGLRKCSKDWILEIDADERVSKKLKNEIKRTINSSNCDWHKINVNNFLGNKVVQYGWGAYFGKSSYAGLFRREKKIWSDERVHPKIRLIGKEGRTLKNKLDHYYCKNISDLFVKLDSYSNARAKDLADMKSNETMMKNVRRIFSRFWKCYVLRKGYMEKNIGFTIALVASIYPLLSYIKYKEKKND